jgi:hypothetical protein
MIITKSNNYFLIIVIRQLFCPVGSRRLTITADWWICPNTPQAPRRVLKMADLARVGTSVGNGPYENGSL